MPYLPFISLCAICFTIGYASCYLFHISDIESLRDRDRKAVRYIKDLQLLMEEASKDDENKVNG